MIVSDDAVKAVRAIQSAVYKVSADKGFHERDEAADIFIRDDDPGVTWDMMDLVKSHKSHYDELMDSNRILLAVGELLEAHDEIRSGHAPTEIYEKNGKPEGVPIELADAIIRILDYGESRGIDIAAAIQQKAEFNNSRPYRHGRKF